MAFSSAHTLKEILRPDIDNDAVQLVVHNTFKT